MSGTGGTRRDTLQPVPVPACSEGCESGTGRDTPPIGVSRLSQRPRSPSAVHGGNQSAKSVVHSQQWWWQGRSERFNIGLTREAKAQAQRLMIGDGRALSTFLSDLLHEYLAALEKAANTDAAKQS